MGTRQEHTNFHHFWRTVQYNMPSFFEQHLYKMTNDWCNLGVPWKIRFKSFCTNCYGTNIKNTWYTLYFIDFLLQVISVLISRRVVRVERFFFFGSINHRIMPAAQGGTKGSVRLLLTKNPARGFSFERFPRPCGEDRLAAKSGHLSTKKISCHLYGMSVQSYNLIPMHYLA